MVTVVDAERNIMRQTSIEAYNYVKENGILARFQFQVYETVYLNDGITQNECHRIMEDTYKRRINKPSVTPNFARLKEMLLIEEIGERDCRVTGRNCLIYSITGNRPFIVKKDKPKSKDQQIKELREEIEALKVKINLLNNRGVHVWDNCEQRYLPLV